MHVISVNNNKQEAWCDKCVKRNNKQKDIVSKSTYVMCEKCRSYHGKKKLKTGTVFSKTWLQTWLKEKKCYE